MELNADFSRRVAVHTAAMPWVASPMAGVERKMLDRIGDEVARATSIVRYAPASQFAPHVHGGGEEFLVLEGVFQDEHGDYPVGTYVRNPPTSEHTPGSADGCVILVKLWQFDPDDRMQTRIDLPEQRAAGVEGQPGVSAIPLHADRRESVRIECWTPNTTRALHADGGLEIFCLDGSFDEGGEPFGRHDWLRLPIASQLNARAGSQGCEIWLKEGHLRQAVHRAPEA